MEYNEIITKGSRVEVSSDEPGFEGAWYTATIVDIVDKTPIKNNHKKTPKKRFNKNNTKKTGYIVKYDTLYEEEDTNDNLCETVKPKFVRPIPPPNGVVDGDDFKVGDIIDAYHRDGWWIGAIKKVSIDVEENRRTYLVSFENPPEDVEFEKDLLRIHVDWVDSSWKAPLKNKKTSEHVSVDINVTHTAESINDAQSGFTTPYEAARQTAKENTSTGCLSSPRKRSRLQQNNESNSEMIKAVEGAAPYDLRKTKSRIENSVGAKLSGDRSRASAGIGVKRKKTVQVHVMERSGSQAMHQDSPILTAENSEAEEGQSRQRTKKGRLLLLEETSKTGDHQTLKSPNGLQEDEGQSQQRTKKGRPLLLEETSKTGDGQMVKKPNGLQEENRNARNLDSSTFNVATSDMDDMPLSIWYQGLRPHSVLNRSQAIVSNVRTNNEQQVWPFVKQSFCWATIESMELHQKQKPHFSPLKKMKEGCREGYALAHILTFENVVRDVLNYQPSNTIEKINDSLELLDELEPHGFDVSAVRGRLNTFLSSKVKVGEFKEELKKFENDIEICNAEKRAADEELNELEVKIRELQEKMVRNVKLKALKDEDIKRLKSNVDIIANKITKAELAIKKFAATPL
uniref:DUF724 domain-containing protein 2-like n=1 Tax=Erigeron canadensis TaxID=72917 RepID=UPI001CB951A0|nr:DUF724 domain-containing protein 2-like [Erigeron canadensis]